MEDKWSGEWNNGRIREHTHKKKETKMKMKNSNNARWITAIGRILAWKKKKNDLYEKGE